MVFLSFGILILILVRRWRVNYDVNKNGTRKKTLTFKVKDVLAEITVSDIHMLLSASFNFLVFICILIENWSFVGYTDEQLHGGFDVLKANPNVSSIYEKWIGTIPARLRDPSIENILASNWSIVFNAAIQYERYWFLVVNQSVSAWSENDRKQIKVHYLGFMQQKLETLCYRFQ